MSGSKGRNRGKRNRNNRINGKHQESLEAAAAKRAERPKIKEAITSEQHLAAQLMNARDTVCRARKEIAESKIAWQQERAQLQARVHELEAQLAQAQINADLAQNRNLVEQYDLPTGQFNFGTENGEAYVEYEEAEGDR